MKDGDTMLFVGGNKTAFRCHCGANVFHRVENRGLKTFECNGCGDWYTDHDSYPGEGVIMDDAQGGQTINGRKQ